MKHPTFNYFDKMTKMGKKTSKKNNDDQIEEFAEKEENTVDQTQNQEQTEDMMGMNGKKSGSKKELEELKIEHAELKDKYLRLFAEFENFKKRTFKEKLDLMKNAAQETMVSLLPVLDDFDRAKNSHDSETSPETWPEGVVLVYNRLYNTMKGKGLQQMESDNEVFDPELHEAITEVPAPNEDMKGKVLDTVEKGYFLNDKLIRHAKVVVGK